MAELNRVPNPPGSPIEKLITQNPLEQFQMLIGRDLSERPTKSEIVAVFGKYNDMMQQEFARQNRVLERWANIHTHAASGSGDVSPAPLATWTQMSGFATGPNRSLGYSATRDTVTRVSVSSTQAQLDEYVIGTDTWNARHTQAGTGSPFPAATIDDTAYWHDFTDLKAYDLAAGSYLGIVKSGVFAQSNREKLASDGTTLYLSGRNNELAKWDGTTYTVLASSPGVLALLEAYPAYGKLIGIDNSDKVTTYIYDIETDTWSTSSVSAPFPCTYQATACVNQYCYMAEGVGNFAAYDIINNIWVTLPASPLSYTTLNDSAIGVIGREEAYFSESQNIWRLTA